MTLRHNMTFSAAALVLVSACGGTSVSAPISLTPAGFNEGATPISYDPASSALTLNGAAVVAPRTTNYVTNGDAAVFRSAAPTTYSAIAQNGDVYAAAVANTGIGGMRGLTYGRRGATELATNGTATFSGDYVGTFGRDAAGGLGQTMYGFVDGDVSLDVDMGNMTLTGDIINRTAYTNVGAAPAATTTFADMQITGGTIANDGTFDATVTGGTRTISLGDYVYVAGVANGAFGGNTGQSVAGVVQLNQTDPGGSLTPHTEVGSFVASRN